MSPLPLPRLCRLDQRPQPRDLHAVFLLPSSLSPKGDPSVPPLPRRALGLVREVFAAAPLPAVALGLCLVLQGLLPGAQVLLLQRLFARLLTPGAPRAGGSAWGPFALYASAALLLSAAGTIELIAFGRLAATVVPRTREAFLAALRRIPLLELEQPAGADRISMANDGSEHTTRAVHGVLRAVGALVQSVGLLAALVRFSPLLAALIFAAAAPQLWIRRRRLREDRDLQRALEQDRRYAGYLSGLFADAGAARDIRLHRLTEPLLARWRALTLRSHRAERALAARLAPGEAAVDLGYGAVLALAFCASLLLVRDRALTLAAWMAAVGAAQAAGDGLLSTVGRWSGIAGDFNLIGDYEAVARDARPEPARRALGPDFRLDVRGVSFRYPGATGAALADVRLRLDRGEHVALVGANGSGKTTLTKVVLGLYAPETGTVSVDGAAQPPGALLSGAPAVFQDFGRYAFTVRDNVAVGDVASPPDDERLWAALRVADAEALVRGLPSGPETVLGTVFPEGVDLSGGQWQRLAIARAAVGLGPLLVLDEPTAALDPLAEAGVYAALVRARAGRGALLISHRMGFARRADLIVVLQAGRVVEQGTHEALLADGGVYARMYETQAGWYR